MISKLHESGTTEPMYKVFAGTSSGPNPATPEVFTIPYGYRPYGGQFSLATLVGNLQYRRKNVDVAHIGSNLGSSHGGDI